MTNSNYTDDGVFEISWTNIESGAKAITKNISKFESKPDVIISSQEDVVAASLVCNEVDLPLCVAHLERRVNGMLVDCLPKLARPIRSGEYSQASMPSIVIVSTLVDNKRNVNGLIKHYEKLGHNVTTMSIYSRKNVENPPDYYWTYLLASVTCRFPWEKL